METISTLVKRVTSHAPHMSRSHLDDLHMYKKMSHITCNDVFSFIYITHIKESWRRFRGEDVSHMICVTCHTWCVWHVAHQESWRRFWEKSHTCVTHIKSCHVWEMCDTSHKKSWRRFREEVTWPVVMTNESRHTCEQVILHTGNRVVSHTQWVMATILYVYV